LASLVRYRSHSLIISVRRQDEYTPTGHGAARIAYVAFGSAHAIQQNYRRTKGDTGRIISALEARLTEYPGDEDLANGECWL
jgi:hypothetical protein